MIGGLGTPELLLILCLAFMLFGVGKLPQVAKMLGSGVNSFRKGLSGSDDDDQQEADDSQSADLLEEEPSTPTPTGGDREAQPETTKSW